MGVFVAAAAVVTMTVVVFLGATLQVYSQFDGDTEALPADCAIVFGAAVYGNSIAGPAIVRRVSTAAHLYRNGQINRLILSGGKGVGNARSEANVMRSEAIGQGVSASDIVLEEESHSTWENIQNSKNLTSGCKSVVGISDAFHLARIELVARRQGWGKLPTIPAGNRPQPMSEQQSVLREVFAYIYYAFYMDTFVTKDVLKEKFTPYLRQRQRVLMAPKAV